MRDTLSHPPLIVKIEKWKFSKIFWSITLRLGIECQLAPASRILLRAHHMMLRTRRYFACPLSPCRSKRERVIVSAVLRQAEHKNDKARLLPGFIDRFSLAIGEALIE
jgi:hypothetical protein